MSSGALLSAYLRRRGNDVMTLAVWHKVLQTLASDYATAEKSLPVWLDAIGAHPLPDFLKPEDDELDTLAGALVSAALNEQSAVQLSTVRRLLESPCMFLASKLNALVINV